MPTDFQAELTERFLNTVRHWPIPVTALQRCYEQLFIQSCYFPCLNDTAPYINSTTRSGTSYISLGLSELQKIYLPM